MFMPILSKSTLMSGINPPIRLHVPIQIYYLTPALKLDILGELNGVGKDEDLWSEAGNDCDSISHMDGLREFSIEEIDLICEWEMSEGTFVKEDTLMNGCVEVEQVVEMANKQRGQWDIIGCPTAFSASGGSQYDEWFPVDVVWDCEIGQSGTVVFGKFCVQISGCIVDCEGIDHSVVCSFPYSFCPSVANALFKAGFVVFFTTELSGRLVDIEAGAFTLFNRLVRGVFFGATVVLEIQRVVAELFAQVVDCGFPSFGQRFDLWVVPIVIEVSFVRSVEFLHKFNAEVNVGQLPSGVVVIDECRICFVQLYCANGAVDLPFRVNELV